MLGINLFKGLREYKNLIIAFILAFLFSIALVYSVFELINVLNNYLLHFFPRIEILDPVPASAEAAKKIGFISLLIITALSVLGLISKHSKLSLASIGYFLPVFGYFTFYMFSLAGIGVLRALYFPLYEVSPTLLRLGDIVLLPSLPLIWFFGFSFSENALNLLISLTAIGFAIFLFGVFSWIYGNLRDTETKVFDFLAYRFSRHPQYLGFLVLSYGFLLMGVFTPYPKGGYFPPPSFLWAIMALFIVCLAMKEEINLIKELGEDYRKYRKKKHLF